MPHYLWLSMGIKQWQCPSCNLNQLAPNLQPGRVYASSDSQWLFLLWNPSQPEAPSWWQWHRSWLPPPQVGRAGGTVQCPLLVEGNRDRVAITRRIYTADGGADGDLLLWHCRIDVLQAQKPRAPQLGAEAALWAYPPQHHGEPCSLSCRKVGHHW